MSRGLTDAMALKELLALMLDETGLRTRQIIEAQDNALAVVTHRVVSETDLVMAGLTSAMAESILLQEQLVGL